MGGASELHVAATFREFERHVTDWRSEMLVLRVWTLVVVLAAAVAAHADEWGPASASERSAAIFDAPVPMTLVSRDVEGPKSLVAVACCKICTKGKACGCISRKKTCHTPPGCACNAK
jgi:hypothetical protein